MLRKPNNEYLTIEEFLKDTQLYFNSKISKFFPEKDSLNRELIYIVNEQLTDVNADNFTKKLISLVTAFENVLNKPNRKTDTFITEIKSYIEHASRYKKYKEPDIISSHDFKWESQESRNKEWSFATEKLTDDMRLKPDSTKLSRKDKNNPFPLRHSYIVIGRRILAMGPKRSSIAAFPAANSKNVKIATDKHEGSWALKIILKKTPEFASESEIAMDLGMALPSIQREIKRGSLFPSLFKTYIPYVYAGTTLSQYLDDMTLPVEKCFEIIIGVVEATIDLHSGKCSQSKTPYVHGDLHPGNATIDSKGKIHFIDFGETEKINDFVEKAEIMRLIKRVCYIFKGKVKQFPEFQDYLSDLELLSEPCPLTKLLMDLKKFKEQLFPSAKLESTKVTAPATSSCN